MDKQLAAFSSFFVQLVVSLVHISDCIV